MSGRGRGRSRGGRGNGNGGRGRGRGQYYTGTRSVSKKGLCEALGNHVFDYGHKACADQMRTSWEKLVQYVGTTMGQDISNELQNKVIVTIAEPVHMTEVLARHAQRELIIRNGRVNIQNARVAQEQVLRGIDPADDPLQPMKLAILQNEIAEGAFELQEDVEKTQSSNAWRTYRERNALLMKHRGHAFSLTLGQCTQMLQDRMKQDIDWNTVSVSYDPLELY